MAILEFILPEGSPDPCPMACGGLTEDPAGGPCKECWAKTNRHDVETCWCDSCDEARAFDEADLVNAPNPTRCPGSIVLSQNGPPAYCGSTRAHAAHDLTEGDAGS